MNGEKAKELKLKRSANTIAVMIKASQLEIGEEKTFKILDLNVQSRIKTRLFRLGKEKNRVYSTKTESNKMTIKRNL